MALPLPDHADAGESLVVIGHFDQRAVVLRTAGAHPEHALVGFTLPARFDGMTVFAPSVLSNAGAQRRHVTASLAIRMQRSGETTTHVVYEDDRVVSASAPQGWLIDACQRSLGLATRPAERLPVELAVVLWLDRLMTRLLRSGIDWPQAASLAPLPARWRSLDAEQIGVMLASNLPSWQAMRRSMAAGEPGPIPLPRQWATWMDDGMFARWCLGSFPDLDSLQADVEFLAPPEVADRVAKALGTALS